MTFRSKTLPLLALVATLAGCSAEAGTSSGPESADDVRATIAAEESGKANGLAPSSAGPHVFAGPDFLVHAALRAPLDLSAEQRSTIEGLLSARPEPGPGFDPARTSKLAAAIRNNNFDGTSHDSVDESARTARLATSAKTIATLHDTLSAAQRSALVDSLKQRASEQAANAKTRHAGRPARGEFAGRGSHGPYGGPMHLLADLNLTQEQKQAIHAKLEARRPAPTAEQREAMKSKFDAMRAEMEAKLEGFKADAFDATAFVAPPKDMPTFGEHRGGELAIITSVLTPEQREALASRIERGPRLERPNAPAPRTIEK